MNSYTVSQAAAVAGLPLKTVQKAIDGGMVPVHISRGPGRPKRLLASNALICLQLEAQGLRQLPPELRKRVFRQVLESPRIPRVNLSTVVSVDVASARQQLAARLGELRRAEREVHSDPAILGGEPVIRGTRVPVYALAEMRRLGSSTEEIVSGYPSIDERQIALAELYATAHPRQGRPARLAWPNARLIRRYRVPLQ